MAELLTDEQVNLLERIKEERDMGEEADLTDWEIEFIDDNLDRFDNFGEKTIFSERQWEIINKIADKLGIS
jgi:predicted transcriptional regulator